jgi:hypothetical protein
MGKRRDEEEETVEDEEVEEEEDEEEEEEEEVADIRPQLAEACAKNQCVNEIKLVEDCAKRIEGHDGKDCSPWYFEAKTCVDHCVCYSPQHIVLKTFMDINTHLGCSKAVCYIALSVVVIS